MVPFIPWEFHGLVQCDHAGPSAPPSFPLRPPPCFHPQFIALFLLLTTPESSWGCPYEQGCGRSLGHGQLTTLTGGERPSLPQQPSVAIIHARYLGDISCCELMCAAAVSCLNTGVSEHPTSPYSYTFPAPSSTATGTVAAGWLLETAHPQLSSRIIYALYFDRVSM